MRILIPDIDSVNSLPAVRHAIREFLDGERFEVHLLHVRSPFLLGASGHPAERALQPARALLDRFHIRYTLHCQRGDKVRAIRAVARRVGASRIILGTARHGSATRWCEDAVIRELLENPPAPVTLVAGRAVSPLERYGVAAGIGATLGLILFS